MRTNDYGLHLIEELVNTQYGDYGGYIQIDGHSGADLFSLCQDHGIDMDKYFLIGLGAGESTISGIGNRQQIHFRALLLETAIYGDSFDQIQKYLQTHNGKVKAKQVFFEVQYKSLNKYIKRFDFMVTTKLAKYIDNIDIEDEI